VYNHFHLFIIQIAQTGFGNRSRTADAPLSTVCAKNEHCAVEPKLAPFVTVNTSGNIGNPAGEPTQAVTAVNKHFLAAPTLSPFVANMQFNNAGSPADEPCPTALTGNHRYIIEPTIQQLGQNGFTRDAVKNVGAPLTTVTAKANHAAALPFLTQYHTEQSGNDTRGQKIADPLLTVDGSPRYALTAAHISKYFAGGRFKDCEIGESNNAEIGAHFHGRGRGAKYAAPEILCSRTGGSWAAKYQEGGRNISHWDDTPPPRYFKELFRVSKNQIIWGGNYFGLPPTRCFLVWQPSRNGSKHGSIHTNAPKSAQIPIMIILVL
jgi:hypothetical protein